MKNCKITSFVLLFILIALGLGTDNDLYAQNKKNKARINADYVKVIGGEHFLNIKASARIDKKTVEVSHIDLQILQELNDEEIEIGKTTTNASGISKFIIKDFANLQPDSSGVYNLIISFDGNDSKDFLCFWNISVINTGPEGRHLVNVLEVPKMFQIVLQSIRKLKLAVWE